MSIQLFNANIAWSKPVPSEIADSKTITVKGRIYYDDYDEHRGGYIILYWERIVGRRPIEESQEGDQKKPMAGQDQPLEIIILTEPGDFSIEIPKNMGMAYLSAKYLIDEDSPAEASATHEIIVGSDNMIVDLRLEECKEIEFYKGPTIKISGEVIVKDYEMGIIRVACPGLEFPIKPTDLFGPGKYSLEVPVGIGNVTIKALNIPEDDPGEATGGMPGTRIGTYDIYVETYDIDGVDIMIE